MDTILHAKEAAKRLACSVWHIYDLMARGEIVEFRDGRSRRTTAESLEDYVRRHSKQGRATPNSLGVTDPAIRIVPPRPKLDLSRPSILRAPPKIEKATVKH